MGILKFFKKADKAKELNLDLPPLPEPSAGMSDLPDAPAPNLPTDLPSPPLLGEEGKDIAAEVKGKDEHALPLDESLPPLDEIPPLKTPEPQVPEPPAQESAPLPEIDFSDPKLPPIPKGLDIPPLDIPELPPEKPPQDVPLFPPKPEIVSTKEPSGTVLPSLPEFSGKPAPPPPPKVPLKALPEFGPEDMVIPRYSTSSYSLKRSMKREGPLFIGIEQFQGVLEGLNSIRDHVKQGEDMAFRMVNLNNNMEKEMAIWHTQVEDIQRKLIFMDKTLFER